jgi:hypothetical protein
LNLIGPNIPTFGEAKGRKIDSKEQRIKQAVWLKPRPCQICTVKYKEADDEQGQQRGKQVNICARKTVSHLQTSFLA